MARGDDDRAEGLLERSLRLNRDLGFRPPEAICVQNLGDVAARRRQFELAKERYETALAMHTEMDDRLRMAAVHHRLGLLALRGGDVDRAVSWLRPALRFAVDTTDRLMLSDCCNALAQVALVRDRPERAARLLGAERAIGESLGADVTAGDTSELDALVDALRARLGPDAFTAAWDAGRAMPRAEVIALALAEVGDDEP
jgi:tetratricopeptide (TPR) repeat protein